MIHTICFFNFWHNGDVYSGKGYMQDLMAQMPNIRFQHAQLNSLKTMSDLPCEQIHTGTMDARVVHNQRYIDFDGVLYINTWVGAYGNAVIPQGQHHANWRSLYTMWMHIYSVIEQVFGIKLQTQDSLFHYIPTTDWSKFNIAPAVSFCSQRTDMVLLCNGLVRSTQSNLGVLDKATDELARDFPHIDFICTTKFDNINARPNIHFTDDIFAGVQDGDINEIAYISTKAFVVVGKNSGPFMFTHVKENIMDPNKIFVSLSHRSSDSYAWGLTGLPCRYYHFNADEEHNVAGVIRKAIWDRNVLGPGHIEELG